MTPHRCFPVNFSKFIRTGFFRSSHPEVFLRKGILKIRSKFTGEHPYRSVISIKLLQHAYSPVNLPHILRTLFPKNTSGWLLLFFEEHCENQKNNFWRFQGLQKWMMAWKGSSFYHQSFNLPQSFSSIKGFFRTKFLVHGAVYLSKNVLLVKIRQNFSQR